MMKKIIILTLGWFSGLGASATTTTSATPVENIKHRIAEKEGWGWASSLNYDSNLKVLHEDLEGKPVLNGFDFTELHTKIGKDSAKLRTSLGIGKDDKNICLACFSFVLTDSSNSSKKKLVSCRDQNSGTGPLENHVFISGTDVLLDKTPQQKDPAKKKYLVCKSPDFEVTSNPKYAYSYSNPDRADKNSRYVFFHPRNDEEHAKDLYLKKDIIERLAKRYAHQKKNGKIDPDLPIHGRLALQWQELIESKDIIGWYREANSAGPYHAKKGNPESSSELFFKRNQDSEQKLLYYLNKYNYWRREFQELAEIIDQLKGLLWKITYVKDSTTESIENKFKDATAHKIRQMIMSEEVGFAEAKIEATLTFKQEVDKMVALNDGKNNLDVVTKRFNALNSWVDKLSIPGGKNDYLSDLTNLMSHIRQILEQVNTLVGTADGIQKLFQAKKELEKIEEEKGYCLKAKDHFMDDFINALIQCLSNNPGYHVSGIVLNINNTYDSCYCCAPDLAQELMREDGFVTILKGRVRDYQVRKNIHDMLPFFAIVSSCGSIRKKYWCNTGCSTNKYSNISLDPKLHAPGVNYYQYELPDVASLTNEALLDEGTQIPPEE